MATDDPPSPLESALDREDPIAIARIASDQELSRLKDAEDLIERRYHRMRRTTKLAIASQTLVGYVALAGFFANAYQNWTSKRQAEARAKQDEERWSKEFKRAQDADKYRAFFETSALATDSGNADKRLVGYALLKEFVDDKDYNAKASLMLEESLAQELRTNDDGEGLGDARRAAIVAILSALSHTSECKSLEHAARSVDKLAKHHAKIDDLEETREIFRIYVRRLVGRGVERCYALKEVRAVRRPIRDTLIRLPELGDLEGKITPRQSNARIAQLLHDRCSDEVESTGVTDCPEIWKGYDRFCREQQKEDPKLYKDDEEGCEIMRKPFPAAAIAPPTSVSPPDAGPSSEGASPG